MNDSQDSLQERIVLVCNDDGIRAPGIAALARAMAPLGEVWVIAPDREQSAVGHGISLQTPLRCENLGARRISVSGTPADCVYMALHRLLPRFPAIVVSGINRGHNIGDDVLYSGTVAAAIEGCLVGIPSLAVSLGVGGDLESAGAIALQVAQELLARPLPARTFLNLNIPTQLAPNWRLKVARLGDRHYQRQVVNGVDPRGGAYYWIGGPSISYAPTPGTDCGVIDTGHPSLTPLQLDMTHVANLGPLSRDWPTIEAPKA